MERSPFIACLKRLYARGQIDEQKLNDLVLHKKISQEALEAILCERKEDR